MALKPRIREVVLLHWYQQLSGDEMAKALGVSRSTVYNRLEKAQKLLRKELEAWYLED
jgi:RNA polymerase sigma-70 factor (ECF subfamily)